MPSGSTGFDVFSSGLFVVARTGVRISLGSGCAAIGAADFPWPAPWRMPLSRTRCATVFRSRAFSVLKLLETCRSRGRRGRSLRLPIPVKRFHQARRLGHFDPGMALRHEGFRLAQLGDDPFGRLDRAGGVPQSGLRRVIFPANELTKIRFAGGSPVRGGPWGYTIHSSLWT